jgi:hypothetical protein
MGVIAHRLRRIRATHRAVREWLRTASAECQQVEPKRRPQGAVCFCACAAAIGKAAPRRIYSFRECLGRESAMAGRGTGSGT